MAENAKIAKHPNITKDASTSQMAHHVAMVEAGMLRLGGRSKLKMPGSDVGLYSTSVYVRNCLVHQHV
jgi:hypothetical protein